MGLSGIFGLWIFGRPHMCGGLLLWGVNFFLTVQKFLSNEFLKYGRSFRQLFSCGLCCLLQWGSEDCFYSLLRSRWQLLPLSAVRILIMLSFFTALKAAISLWLILIGICLCFLTVCRISHLTSVMRSVGFWSQTRFYGRYYIKLRNVFWNDGRV